MIDRGLINLPKYPLDMLGSRKERNIEDKGLKVQSICLLNADE
jgi:hypothetical protein